MTIYENFKKHIMNMKAAITPSPEVDIQHKIKKGTIRQFDTLFYKQLEGKYFNGIPVYYYLYRMNMGKCYDCSAILALALGNGAKVARGNLKNMAIQNRQEEFGHGWVEKDGLVYDTTWRIICNKDDYYKIMGVKNAHVVDSGKFFHDCKGIANWEIHDKAYYETHYCPLESMLIFQVREIENLVLNHPTQTAEQKARTNYFTQYDSGEESKAFAKKVLEDLPDTSKVKVPSIFDYM